MSEIRRLTPEEAKAANKRINEKWPRVEAHLKRMREALIVTQADLDTFVGRPDC